MVGWTVLLCSQLGIIDWSSRIQCRNRKHSRLHDDGTGQAEPGTTHVLSPETIDAIPVPANAPSTTRRERTRHASIRLGKAEATRAHIGSWNKGSSLGSFGAELPGGELDDAGVTSDARARRQCCARGMGSHAPAGLLQIRRA